MEAEFVAFADGVVSVKRSSDGNIFNVPFDLLSSGDQAYARLRKEAEFRTWTSTVGTTIEARFAGNIGDMITLEKRDGTTVTL